MLEGFTADLGPKITLSSFSSNEELISKLVAAKGTSGYDIVVPTGTFIPQMIENGLLAKLNLDLIPNLEHVDPAFLGRAWDPDNEYSICKAWGTTGFVYDKTVITRELKDWNDFLDAAQNEASGKTSVLDDPAELTGLYFWANGIDWNTTDPADLDAAEDYLVNTLAPHVSAFDSYPGGAAIPQATHALMQAWNGDARIGMIEGGEPERWQWVLGGPGDRDLDGQLGDPRRCTEPRGGARVHRLRARPRELARRARLHRLPHGGRPASSRRRTTPTSRCSTSCSSRPSRSRRCTRARSPRPRRRIVEIWNAMKAAAGA